MNLVDYSFTHTTVAQLKGVLDSADPLNAAADKAAGYLAHGRYLLGQFAMTDAEVEDATAHGVGILSLCEKGAQAALGGALAGHSDAHANLVAAEKRKQPGRSALIATVDFDPLPGQLPAVLEYLTAFSADVRSAGFLSGAYGGTAVMERSADIVDIRMQAAGWSNGITVPGCHLYQQIDQADVGGVQCDVSLVGKSPFGAWNLHGPVPPLSTTEEEMILTTLHDGATVLFFPAESGFRPIGPEWVAWLESAGIEMKPALPQSLGSNLVNLGPFSAK